MTALSPAGPPKLNRATWIQTPKASRILPDRHGVNLDYTSDSLHSGLTGWDRRILGYV